MIELFADEKKCSLKEMMEHLESLGSDSGSSMSIRAVADDRERSLSIFSVCSGGEVVGYAISMMQEDQEKHLTTSSSERRGFVEMVVGREKGRILGKCILNEEQVKNAVLYFCQNVKPKPGSWWAEGALRS